MEVSDSHIPTSGPRRSTLELLPINPRYAYGTITLYGEPFQATSASLGKSKEGPNPTSPFAFAKGSVWAVPLSVAPTKGIPIGISSIPYLDVSVQGVPVPYGTPKAVNLRQDVPLGDLRIKGCMRLPGAYRCLPRPSSAPEPSHPPIDVGVSDPVSSKPSLVPETLEPVHGGHHKAVDTLLRPSLKSFLLSCMTHWTQYPLSCMVGVSGSFLGGDPAAGSPAATLLRLLPPCQT